MLRSKFSNMNYAKYRFLIYLLLPISSVIGQDISIKGIFPNDRDINISIHFLTDELPSKTYIQKADSSKDEQTIVFQLSSKEFINLHYFQLYTESQNDTIYLKEIIFSNILKANASGIKNSLYIYEHTCPHEIKTVNGQDYFVFHEGNCALIINEKVFSNSRPIGFHLFLCLCLFAILLILIFILYKKSF